MKANFPRDTTAPSNGTAPVVRNGAKTVAPEAIAERAYQKFNERGAVHGFDQQDWAEAEQELGARNAGR